MQKKASTGSPLDAMLSEVVGSVTKKFGADSMTFLPDHSEFGSVTEFVSFGHWALDYIVSGKLVGGGVPIGRLTEIYGGWSSGKSLLIAHLLASCQKMGGIAVLDDTEHAYMRDFGARIGVNNSKLLYTASESVEEVFDKMAATITLITEKDNTIPVLYAWDSLALVASAKELNEELSGEEGGYHTEKARAIGRGTRKIVSLIGKSKVALVIANQTRQKIGVMFGNPETTPGGDAVPFWASVRVRLAAKKQLVHESTKDVYGMTGEASTKKNKINEPFKSCGFSMTFKEGLQPASGAIDLLVKAGVLLSTSPGWYELGGRKFQRSALESYLLAHPEALGELL